ncbi:tyrosine-type recombinase/integrase [Streptomyces sp. NPDC018955]|uniref:tyrosine-type recombinase/integrase n=1 Tax=Streptomyces sp. NPDC018955 TaxID=3365055 RepID=UPI0037A546B3
MTTATEATDPEGGVDDLVDAELVDAELVDDEPRFLPAPADAPPPYRITRDTVLVEGELPPRADRQPAFTERDFTVPKSAKRRTERRGARNTQINRDTTRARFAAWCEEEGRVARPSTTTANVLAYFDHLMERGKEDGSRYSPDTLLAYLPRIVSWYPKGERPDASVVRDAIEDYRLEDYVTAGGEREQAAGLTLAYLVRILAEIDETTRIGRRDAALLVIGYGKLARAIETADLLVKNVRVTDKGVWVFSAKTKTRRKGKGKWRFIRDRADLQTVRRVRAWLADLRELGADAPALPLFRALTVTGGLKGRGNATVRGLHLSGRAVNEIVKKRAREAGVEYINGLKVTSHSLRAGPNTDMKRAKVPLSDRNEAGDWGARSTLSDTEYDRPDDTVDVEEKDPLDAVPLFGRFEKTR